MNKSKLQELCHQYSWNFPDYTILKDGPDHNPRFTATVVVNGVTFETPKDIQCSSSKEAQNVAAKFAFDHFTAPMLILPSNPNSLPVHNTPFPSSSGLSISNTNLDVEPVNKGILQPAQQENVQTSQANKTPEVSKEVKNSKDMLHLYKNRLQQYAEKKNISFPMYSCELDGPPHARRFKSRVTIEGRTYEASEYFSTLKDAEHAAAKVAFESVSLDDFPEDDSLYKYLLQELALKEGFLFPTYTTVKSGPPHMPTFISTLELGIENFQGTEAKTKKQAEMNAAKAAYSVLTERRESWTIPVLSPGDYSQKDLEISSSNFPAIFADESQPNIKRKPGILICEEQAEENKEADIDSKSYEGSSSSEAIYAQLQGRFPSMASNSIPSEYSPNNSGKSDNFMLAETSSVSRTKVVVYPRKLSMAFPEGATELPFSNDKWVAVKMEPKQIH